MVSDKKFFHVIPYISLCKTCDRPPRWDHLRAKEHYLNKLGRGPLGDAAYQISRLLWFQTRRFLKFSSRKCSFSMCDLDMQQTRTICTIIEAGHTRIIPAKFGKNQVNSLGGDVL